MRVERYFLAAYCGHEEALTANKLFKKDIFLKAVPLIPTGLTNPHLTPHYPIRENRIAIN